MGLAEQPALVVQELLERPVALVVTPVSAPNYSLTEAAPEQLASTLAGELVGGLAVLAEWDLSIAIRSLEDTHKPRH